MKCWRDTLSAYAVTGKTASSPSDRNHMAEGFVLCDHGTCELRYSFKHLPLDSHLNTRKNKRLSVQRSSGCYSAIIPMICGSVPAGSACCMKSPAGARSHEAEQAVPEL